MPKVRPSVGISSLTPSKSQIRGSSSPYNPLSNMDHKMDVQLKKIKAKKESESREERREAKREAEAIEADD